MTSSLPLPILAPPQARRIAILPAKPRLSYASLLGVVGAHAALLSLMWLAPDAPEPVAPPRPLAVSLITPAPTEPVPQSQPESTPEPKPDPRSEPRPALQPVAKPQTPPPVLVAERLQAAPQPVIEAPSPAPQPESVPEILPPPAPPTVAETAKPAPAPSPPAPLSPPRAADYLHNPKPPYPALSRRLGEEGIVRLNVLVNPDGSVARLEIARSSGHPRLDDAAARTVQTSWKFEPARQGGKPVQAWVIVPIHFILGS